MVVAAEKAAMEKAARAVEIRGRAEQFNLLEPLIASNADNVDTLER